VNKRKNILAIVMAGSIMLPSATFAQTMRQKQGPNNMPTRSNRHADVTDTVATAPEKKEKTSPIVVTGTITDVVDNVAQIKVGEKKYTVETSDKTIITKNADKSDVSSLRQGRTATFIGRLKADHQTIDARHIAITVNIGRTTISGKVTAADKGNLTVLEDNGRVSHTVNANSAKVINAKRNGITPGDIDVGDQITAAVHYEEDLPDELTAIAITNKSK
jgi:hypothetical protein